MIVDKEFEKYFINKKLYKLPSWHALFFDYGSICLTLVPQNSGPNNADTKKTPITENCASVTSNVLNLSVPDT